MKEDFRREIMKNRKSLSFSKLLEKSNQIKIRLFNIYEFRNADSILFYVSYGKEVYTHSMIKECMSKGLRVVVPKSNTVDDTLILSDLSDWDDLEKGAYNILEPKNDCIKEVSIDLIDLMIIPGVVFDVLGNRIGHGYGYYDRLLMKASTVSKIGLAFEMQIVERISAEEHDVKVDKIVTEERVVDCKKF